MTADMSVADGEGEATKDGVAIRSDIALLRTIVVVAGLCWSFLFVVIGLGYELQLYADGSLFSYAVAVQDAWAFHWHNIPGRVFVYLFAYVPAQTIVGLTENAHTGVIVYGFLFFVAQLLGLAATFAADRSKGRILFCTACASTACLCPLVFGFPTEMWMAHAAFWPALAVCHYARGGIGGIALVFAVLLMLVLTHEGAVIFAVAIVKTVLLRGMRDRAFLRAAGLFVVVMAIWGLVKIAFLPDDYVGTVMARIARHFFDADIMTSELMLLLAGTLALYAMATLLLHRLSPAKAHLSAAAIVALTLAAYWLWFDRSLHTDNRYYMRTVLLLATLVLGTLAAAHALAADGRLALRLPFLPRMMAVLTNGVTIRAGIGAVLLVTLVHTVETVKFVRAWSAYVAAVRTLATGTASDPALGDARFVSSDRIGDDLKRLSWSSSTHFLSVLVTPDFAPTRLVVDPHANYFSLSCATARANEEADRVIPVESRRLVRIYACLHR